MAVLPPDPVFCFKGDMGHIHSLCFPQSRQDFTTQLVASTESGWVYIWDLETNRQRHKQQMGASIQSVHCSEDSIIVQEKSGLVSKWVLDQSTYTKDVTYECGGGFCRSIIIDDYLLVPQHSDLEIITLDTFKVVTTLKPGEGKYGNVMAVQTAKINNADYILAGYETGDLIGWEFATGKKLSQTKLRDHITSLTFDPVSLRGVCGNASNTIEVFSVDKDLNVQLKGELSTVNEGTGVVQLRPFDRKIVASGGWDGRIRIFSWKTLRPLVVLNEHKGPVTDIQFSSKPVKYWDSNVFAASGSDGKISLWNIYN